MTASASRRDALPAGALNALRKAIERVGGIVLTEGSIRRFEAIVQSRMTSCGVSDPDEYREYALKGLRSEGELRILIERLVVGETSFFRAPEQYDILRDHIFPELVSGSAPVPFSLWSAGCATGEEAYTLAIVALEALGRQFFEPVRILATDISREFLAIASQGVYPSSATREIPPSIFARYFVSLPDGRIRVSDRVRRLVRFEEGNLAEISRVEPGVRHAVVFCRNVLIYFDTETVRTVIRGLHGAMEENGVLFLGHSESLWGISEVFRLEKRGGAYVYRRGSPARAGAPPACSRPSAAGSHPGLSQAAEIVRAYPDRGSDAMRILREAERLADGEALDVAERKCREAVGVDPECPEAHYLLAVILRRRDRHADAVLHAKRALACNPRFVLGAAEAAECLQLLGRDDEAQEYWREVLRLSDCGICLPRLAPATGVSQRSLREYATARLGAAAAPSPKRV